MLDNQLYINSSNALLQARNAQAQISQKELEMKLLEINNQYNYNNPYSYSFDSMKKQGIEMEISNLKNNRDMNINYATDYALILIEQEMANKNSFSMAAIAVDSINSFISSYNIDFKLSISIQMKITEVSFKLQSSGMGHLGLKSAIDRLKTLCGIY